MGTQLAPSDLALYRAVDEVLHYVWDPIGVAHAPEARDEYQSYLPRVYAMLRDGVGEGELAAYLTSVTDYMGLSPKHSRDLQVAKLLRRWRAVVDEG